MITVVAVEPRLDALLSVLDDQGGTDVLLTDGSKPLMRVRGQLSVLDEAETLTGEEIEVIARTQLDDLYGDQLHLGTEIDFSFTWQSKARIRANAFYQRGTCSLSLKRIPLDVPGFAELGLPAALDTVLDRPGGLVLVAGSSGSGQSASMASMIDALNRRRRCHIVTIEDPIEYLHTNRMAAVSQREVGKDTATFATALRSVLREDPDVVLLGELGDPETIAAALTIAETGHLLITTMPAGDSIQAVERVVDVFAPDRRHHVRVQLAATLLAVLHQRLVPRAAGGSAVAYELMVATPAVRELIRAARTRELRDTFAAGRDAGMQTLEESLSALVADGTIGYDAAVGASLYPDDVVRPR